MAHWVVAAMAPVSRPRSYPLLRPKSQVSISTSMIFKVSTKFLNAVADK